MSAPQITPSQARICDGTFHSRPIVTVEAICTHCGAETSEHPEAKDEDHYCVECGDGPFPTEQCHVVTDEEDPYIQIDDGDLITVCLSCKAKRDSQCGD